ncbi:MAG: hypothetical protein NWP87_01500 [Winogradskyella sp.]|nr:hypothetical protein [Winogradskyella sp.]
MNSYLKILTLFVLTISCQSNKSEEISDLSNLEKETRSQKNDNNLSKDLQSKTTLTKQQFNDFFPKEIGAYKLINVSVLMSSGFGGATYIKDNDYNTSMTYSLEDGNRKNSAITRNFEVSYNMKAKGPEETEYIYTERDGYKTIAFLQSKINRNDVRFVYNNRFRITLEGTDLPDKLWLYINFDNLKKLDQLN